ncbi:RNA polymerase sigma factor SigJ [Denitrobaculum tricleocarpae]|uniref:RNA polymerase sigma-70 factor n=1 Tax=Denitrobaculum tricleocarpae TaxID=2591009 RepID=A0A545TUM4_9PROT|nr:RNA polymerase sigma factor SigJ [Denitrobaculum tricleocarpae]TQV80925.1 RNA polymerase sigma-70 factor [Denitrobaculum tricleocarpae]
MKKLEDTLTACRGRLLGLAYRMLGSHADAEDIVQDAYLRVSAREQSGIRDPEAFLFTTVTRLCLDQLKSARARREVYVGPWLPEPVIDSEILSPERATELSDDLSFALLLTLEKLSAAERAAFILHDVFDTSFKQIAETLGKSEAACRQLAARARRAVKTERPNEAAAPELHRTLLTKFAEAVATGDTSRLRALLAADVVSYSDGGGRRVAALNPVVGAEKVARFFVGLFRKHKARGRQSRFHLATLNGLPGFVTYTDGELDHTLSVDLKGERISRIYLVRNPEKLGAVGSLYGT